MNDNDDTQPRAGVFIAKGMRISIPSFSLRINEEGKVESDAVSVHTEFDVCPVWFGIALEHLAICKSAAHDLPVSKKSGNPERIAAALESEFRSGMQAITASCIAVDAYYAMVRGHIDITESDVQKWRKNRTARYRQIAEVFRRAFAIKDDPAEKLREILRQCFEWRDKAIHPHSGTRETLLHPELEQATDQRFVLFRFFNAHAIVNGTLSVVLETARNSSESRTQRLHEICEELVQKLSPIEARLQNDFGKVPGSS